MFLIATAVQGQILIGGNVYGGGNEGPTSGNSSVVIRSADIDGSVFGGARQANVGGWSFVNIDGEHMSGDILINYVYGGNDIAGTIGTDAINFPAGLTETTENGIDHTYNSFVLTTKERTEAVTDPEPGAPATTQPYCAYIGQLFGGGNGDYDYVSDDSPYKGMVRPEVGKAYIEMRGGSCVLLYGGGNNATVTEATDICIDNASAVTFNIYERNEDGSFKKDGENKPISKLTNQRLLNMGIYELGGAGGIGANVATSPDYQFSRVFGGNNKAEMSIRPRWHLKKGMIRNLYSGGNRGAMTYEKGLYLPIVSADMEVNNVFGGCRMADVNPGKLIQEETIEGVLCPPGYAARVHIGDGTINNVYGGNDISGTVYGGTAVGIHSSILGDVYGGGNGSYSYTDNTLFKPTAENANEKSTLLYGDYFYDVNEILGLPEGTAFTGQQSAEALCKFRPNAEAVSVRLIGTELKPTFIGGSVYCGGNSATLRSENGEATAQLKIGAYVYADKVFLGNNGENMIGEALLSKIAGNVTIEGISYDFNKMELKADPTQFATYMQGCELDIEPEVVFDPDYEKYTAYFGSFYCGGNVGSIKTNGLSTINFNHSVIIFEKLVGGCNSAIVPEGTYNARYVGGVIGDPDASGNKLTLNLSGLEMRPMRWKDKDDKSKLLEWNTISSSTGEDTPPVTTLVPDEGKTTETSDAADLKRRLKGGNIYGGCYTSGIVNGNITLNINATLMDRNVLFDKVKEDEMGEAILYGEDIFALEDYHIEERRTGVILDEQGMDVLGEGLNVYGGGKGKETEIWGSTTINLNKGYVFQIFGGSEEGVIGKSDDGEGDPYTFNGKTYKYNPKYSCTVNLRGPYDGVSKQADHSENMAEAEFIYGGGFLGPICGNTTINLGKGRVFDTFAGSCNADILGHTETYVGRHIGDDGSVGEGFPYIRDYTYGGNDLGGKILGKADFNTADHIRSEVASKIHSADVAKNVSAYMEYTQGRAEGIFGGCYGTYDYKDETYRAYFDEDGSAQEGYSKPRMGAAFVNFRPTLSSALKSNPNNKVNLVYGAGQGYPADADRDVMQERSYILIDIPQEMENYQHMDVFGAGAWSGLGMSKSPEAAKAAPETVSAVIDLIRGQIAAAYGGSYQEGVTRRTVVNVPTGSTIQIGSIFGGAYGTNTYCPCDVYESNVNWHSADAVLRCDPLRIDESTEKEVGDDRLTGAIYGGNNNERRTVYGHILIDAPMKQRHWKYGMTLGTAYGAGHGANTWAEYTEILLNNGAQVYEVYGGGQAGKVHNAESVQTYMDLPTPTYTWPAGTAKAGEPLSDEDWKAAWVLGGGYDPQPIIDPGTGNPVIDPITKKPKITTYWENTNTNLANELARVAEMDDRDFGDLSEEDLALVHYKYCTNVIINKGATVENYAYGGGLGEDAVVAGTTYIALLGGTVKKDIYAAGTSGAVQDLHGAKDYSSENRSGFMASANAYIAGGTVRNVYGGGWKGSVGRHKKTVTIEGKDVEVDADIHDPATNDIGGETHVVIGIRRDQSDADLLAEMRKVKADATLADYGFYCGLPTVQRNAYGGGEGGAVYGKAYLTLNNGYIGYAYNTDTEKFEEKINDETYFENEKYAGDNRLRDCGNVFGGGYDARSSVDESYITIWGGEIRGSLHGGGEIATIGRGSTKESGAANHVREFQEIYKVGKTHIEMYNGHVGRNVFGGGKGYNLLGYGSNSDLYTDGYTFGQTEVYIHGGEVGTEAGMAEGYGNVFGGGDLGYVYSKGYENAKTKADKANGVTTGSPGHYYYYYNDGTGDHLIEDCKVVIAPYLQIKADGTNVSYNNREYKPYEYVPTDYLNTLPKNKADAKWTNLVTEDAKGERGVQIHNAVFGGGNVASNTDTHYANATTVYGNTTATLYDVYHRDFITVGTEHVGGLYGGGNLSMVDGYRELNVTNYGTDYYNLQSRITLQEYHNLSNRERAYFKLEYECVTEYTVGSKTYHVGDKISEEDYHKLDTTHKSETYWKQYGFCSIYAGRLLNTIQRADLCGVYGSRMVLQGAKDRVAEVGEKVDYTINRVGELSLNKQVSLAGDTGDDAVHGNYFGIYSIVHYLGNMTSDVRFVSKYIDQDGIEDPSKSFYTYKEPQPKGTWRNRGTCHNQVALASGVFLELTTENSTPEHKDYGYITGVVELDLINVKREIEGGGFVYAKNEHRLPVFYEDMDYVILSEYNQDKDGVRDAAKTFKRYRYAADAKPVNAESWPASGGFVAETGKEYTEKEIQTSGNFIHHSKRIVDDCYPVNNRYLMADDGRSEAHYWYIKGSVYVYDQVVSAYTGSATAYSKTVHLPLTITAAANGQLKLLNVKPNRYAYYYKTGGVIGTGENAEDKKVWVNQQADAYELNDVITWWDWQNLPESEQAFFVEETYVNCMACQVDGVKYSTGEYVMLPTDITAFKAANHTITDYEGNELTDKDGNKYTTNAALIDDLFRSSNNVSHNTGYVLTFDMDTPEVWNDYYTVTTDTEGHVNEKIKASEYKTLLKNAADEAARQAIIDGYTEGPTFSPKETKVLGHRQYTEGQILTEAEYDQIDGSDTDAHKEYFETAYVANRTIRYTYTYQDENDQNVSVVKTINPGTAISQSEYNSLTAEEKTAFAVARVCAKTVKLAEEKYLIKGDLLSDTEIATLKTTYSSLSSEIDDAMTNAYICTKDEECGGRKYLSNTNYSAIQSWCSLSETDRAYFTFNYDALNLLADPNYSVDPDSNDDAKSTKTAYHQPYSDEVSVEYRAVFKATSDKTSYTYNNGTITLTDGQSMTNTDFETYVRNDKRYYTHVNRISDFYTIDDETYFYVANKNFVYDGTPYGTGQVVSHDVYQHRTSDVDQVVPTQNADKFYYCYEAHEEGNTSVAKGTQISEDAYKALTDDQKYFVIQGKEPEETTTLYVTRESDIKDVTKEKIITVVYQYTYYETDDDGDIRLTNELHVVNVHLQLESGVPTIGTLENPPTVLPGNAVGLKAPEVTPGAYEVLTNGWEIFDNKDDADHHRNGVPFTNNSTPVYWYQNRDHYIAFYSKTYLGKTYSNYVPLSVANYHDLADIMERHKDNHLYIDRADVDRPCKIYINNYSTLPDDDARKGKNGLDELKALYDLSIGTSMDDHTALGSYINGCSNLDIILRTDLDHSGSDWTSIGASTCFGGTLHGDGHTISGLTQSLFNKLCGNVYNLGVTGSFAGAGVAETGEGYVENCWVKTTGTPTAGTKAVFGNPSRLEGTQLVNCYYPENNAYSETPHDRGNARKMPEKAFYDGEVAYNLNGFYLNKRYYDHNTEWEGTKNEYDYILANADGTLPQNAESTQAVTTLTSYPSGYAVYLPQSTRLTPRLGYVEHRYYDGDFRYADGTIPETFNIRRQEHEYIDDEDDKAIDITWAPIWPDDYLFFGQKLTYGHVEGHTHQPLPAVINKIEGRLLTNALDNRVFRAPAYFQNSHIQVAHFNPNAVFAKENSDQTLSVHKNMTAIDFTGGNGDVSGGYKQGILTTAPYNHVENGAFFPPLLDDNGLTSFRNIGLTKNLLAYTMTTTDAAKKTDAVVSDILHDFPYEETNTETYRTVAPWDTYAHWKNAHGHWVQWTETGSKYIAQNDHLLIDKQDFNAPIAYTFEEDKRMWYQRQPGNFVSRATGWEGISIPFKAEIVTTQQKGELTHFYKGSTYGHEYWLREFKGGTTEGSVFKASFQFPDPNGEDGKKTYTNTFLWDYYYSFNGYDDENLDDYQENDAVNTYYKDAREYAAYPRLTEGTPYLIGFPSETYYEFDLSGRFTPLHTSTPVPEKLDAQVITFASKTGIGISVSDTELEAKAVTFDGYTYRPSYLNKNISDAYTLKSDGSQYEKIDAGDTDNVGAFRPYFVVSGGGGKQRYTRSIVFSYEPSELKGHDDRDLDDEQVGSLNIYTKRKKIVVVSSLSEATEVRIINTAGITLTRFRIEPGEAIETPVPMSGVFIVRTDDGKYQKKIAVK